MINLLGIFSGFNDTIFKIAGIIAVVAIIVALIKHENGKIFLGFVAGIAFIVATVYCGVQLNYYYTETGGIYGQIVSLYNPNKVTITNNVSYSFENIVLTQDYDNIYSARITSDEVLNLVLDENASYGVYVNEMPCSYVEITDDYVIAKYEYAFLGEDMSILMTDTLTFKFAFYTNSTYLVVTTEGGAEAVKYWNYYFNKNVFNVTIDNKGYSYNQDINFGTGDISEYSVVTYYLNDELYLKQVYQNGNAIKLPFEDYEYKTSDGAIINSGFVVTSSLSIYMSPTNFNYSVVFDANGGTGVMSNQALVYGVSENLSSNAYSKDGYSFVGWSTTPDGEVEYFDCASVSGLTLIPNDTVVLYAQWSDTYYTAYIYLMNTSASYPSTASTSQKLTFIPGTELDLESEASRLGVAVDGGLVFDYAKVSDTDEIITSVTASTDNSTIIRFYFKRLSYTLTYDANGGTVSPTSVKRYYGAQYGTLPTPTRDGYIFDGWYTFINGGELVYFTKTMGTSDVTIYAHWTKES